MEGLIVQGEEGVRSSLGDQRVQRPRGVEEGGTEQPRGTGTASEEEMARTWLQRGQGHSQSALYARQGV